MTATKDLTKLQVEMDFLAGVKCPSTSCMDGTWDSGVSDEKCEICNGIGKDPKYDVLRVKCLPREHLPFGYCYKAIKPDCPGYTTLPAGRAHEAVGKLLALTDPITRNNRGQWFIGVRRLNEPWHDTPEGALIAALCNAEGGKL